MAYGRNGAYIGGGEVTDLIGAWQQIVGAQPWHQIVGAQPWQQIVGADVSFSPYGRYPQYPNRYPQYPHHHHHHPRAPYSPYAAPYTAPYAAPYNPYAAPATVRDHRRAYLQSAAVRGDPVALSGLALMGAEDAQAAQTGVPPQDATIPAPPLPVTPEMTDPQGMPPGPPPMEMAPQPQPLQGGHHGGGHHHHHRRHTRRTNGPDAGPPMEYGWPIAPRNGLIDYAGPSRADRVVLPMSSGVNILPNTSAQITARPQNVAFRPERLIIGGTPGDWIINDVKVGNRSQFSQAGDVPGELFAATTIDSFVSFETVQTAMDFVILVTFVGASESGAPFVCGVLGTAAI